MSEKTLYSEIVAAGIDHGSHQSDLYVADCPQAREIIERYPIHKANIRIFTNGRTQSQWIDIPFAYQPFWDKARDRAKARPGITHSVQAHSDRLKNPLE